ncbi:MAG: AarF/UbiB family protein, partial [Gammaproteobacteria bacterium]
EAKEQLHKEADYRIEAGHMIDYAELIKDDDRFELPTVIPELSGERVLAMSYLAGDSIETAEHQPREIRDRIATTMIDLTLAELFHWQRVQSDPNFANYRFNAETGRIGLLDFGGVREYDKPWTDTWARLMLAGAHEDRETIREAAITLGYITETSPSAAQENMVDMILTASEPSRAEHGFNFGESTLVERLARQVYTMRTEHDFWILPAIDVLFLHRKLGGIYQLCARLHATVDVRELMERHLLDGG